MKRKTPSFGPSSQLSWYFVFFLLKRSYLDKNKKKKKSSKAWRNKSFGLEDVNFILITVYAAIKTQKKSSPIILIKVFCLEVNILKNFICLKIFSSSKQQILRNNTRVLEKKVNKFFILSGHWFIGLFFRFLGQGTQSLTFFGIFSVCLKLEFGSFFGRSLWGSTSTSREFNW